MQSEKYKTIQVPVEAYAVLKEYCEAMNHRMGKFVGDLIMKSCVPLSKKPVGGVLRVENKEGGQ